NLDLLFLDRRSRPDAFGGTADLLARTAAVFLGARNGCPAMKILFLEQFSELGGGQRNLLDLLPAVIERGCKAIVAAPGNGPLFAAARAIGAQTESIPFGRYANGQKTPADAARLGIDTFLMSRRIARMDADMISIGGARLLPAAAFGARGRRVIFQAQHFFED